MIIKTNNYNIVIENLNSDILNLERYSSIILLTERKIWSLWHQSFSKLSRPIHVIEIESGEGHKNLETAAYILQAMINLNCDRKSLLINFGGGMISDLGGFVASTYMRGINFINIPTTLLSMVDASIGGKNAINIGNIKNIIGTFNDPSLVCIDTRFLDTLETRELKSAFAEIIKHGIIWDKNYFHKIYTGQVSTSIKDLHEIIARSIEIKKEVVEQDFEEKNIRKILNFGHTIGHAFESYSINKKNPLLHGEAVAIGMIIESRIAMQIGILSQQDYILIENCIAKCGFEKLLNAYFDYNIKDLVKLALKDKKNENQKINLSIPQQIGKCNFNVEVALSTIELVIEHFFHERNSQTIKD